MGHGHVMRCLTLASALRERGLRSAFVCKQHAGNLCDLIEERGFAVVRLPVTEMVSSVSKTSHASWLGSSLIEDAELTRAAIERTGVRPQWLVVDHYAVDHHWETLLRPAVDQLMAIDDLADRSHDCDVLLDQNFFLNLLQRYVDRVPPECTMLLGPKYALLQSVYAELHAQAEPKNSVRRIFMFFGGADTENLTGRALSAFQKLERPDIRLDVVMISGSASYAAVQEQVSGRFNICLHGSLPSLGPIMATADLAIGAGGATVWERLCLGLPSVVISLAENQKPVCRDLASAGLIRYLGFQDQVDEGLIHRTLSDIIDSQGIPEWSRRCHAVCDGEGIGRVAEVIVARTLQIAHRSLMTTEKDKP
jgi:UDP-2,4-diacetamido-2,4,6-trideoxy-beta-L-altropyranose hydrolase